MGKLNYSNLTPEEFEALAKDVMSRMLGVNLSRFGEGRDNGIDLTDDTLTHNIVVQCKRYENNNKVVSKLIRETQNLEVMDPEPKQYYIFTSASLTPKNVQTLRITFAKYMESDKNIIHNATIEDFFNDPSNLDILKKYPKLFTVIVPIMPNNNPQITGFFTPKPIPGNIVGRDNIATDIERKLSEKPQLLLLNGVGGIGKTALTKKIYWDLCNRYECVGWINYTDSFANSLLMAANENIFPDQDDTTRYRSINDFFAKDYQSKLIIIDDVSNDFNEDETLADLLTWKNTTVIMTSRLNEMKGIESVVIGQLNEEDGFQLFANYYDDYEDLYEHRDTVLKLLSWAKYHTLTIELIAKAAEFENSLEEYCDKLYTKGFDTLDINIGTLHANKKYPFEEHLKYLFDLSSIKEEREKYRILWCFAIMPTIEIPRNFITWISANKHDLRDLVQLGWIEKHGPSYYMHALVKEVLHREGNTPSHIEDAFLNYVNDENHNYFNEECNYAERRMRYDILKAFLLKSNLEKSEENCQLLLTLMQGSIFFSAFQDTEDITLKMEQLVDDDEDYIDYKILLYSNAGNFYDINGMSASSVNYYKKALSMIEELDMDEYEDEDIDLINTIKAQILFSLSSISAREHKSSTATDYLNLVENDSVQTSILSSEITDSMHYQVEGEILFSQGKFTESETLFQKAIDCLSDQNNLRYALLQNNLGEVHRALGNFALAREKYLMALTVLEQYYQGESSHIATECNNIGTVCVQLNNYQEAEEYLLRGLSYFDNSTIPVNVQVATLLNSLGALYLSKGDFESSEDYYSRCIEYLNELDMEESMEMASCLNGSGTLLNMIGNYTESHKLLTYSIELMEHLLGPEHQSLIIPYLNLVNLLLTIQDFDTANSYLEKAGVILDKYWNYDSAYSINYFNFLGLLHTNLGEFSEGEAYLKQALQLCNKYLGYHNLSMASILSGLSSCYIAKEQYIEAINYANSSLSIQISLLGVDHIALCDNYLVLGLCYQTQEYYDRAEDCYKKIIVLSEKFFGGVSPISYVAYSQLGELYRSIGNYNSSLDCFCMCYQYMEEIDSDEQELTEIAAVIYEVYLESGRNPADFNTFILNY